jgi:hypothetical protein
MGRRFLRFVISVALLSLVVIPPSTPLRADDVGLLKFVNRSKASMRFYIDGAKSCLADPGSYCNDSTSVGSHYFSSRYEDTHYLEMTACEAEKVYVPAAGTSWTCDPSANSH